MASTSIILLISGIVALFVLVWLGLLAWVRHKSRLLAGQLARRIRETGEELVLGPRSCLYRGADRRFGNIKGNGIICLTDKRLIFEKLTGQQIEIDRSQIIEAEVTDRFRGEIVLLTGGRHLVVKTGDHNRIGFLLKDAEPWAAAIKTA